MRWRDAKHLACVQLSVHDTTSLLPGHNFIFVNMTKKSTFFFTVPL